jgi:hypothetical protein
MGHSTKGTAAVRFEKRTKSTKRRAPHNVSIELCDILLIGLYLIASLDAVKLVNALTKKQRDQF